MNDFPWADLAQNVGFSALAIVIALSIVMAIAIRINNHSIIDVFWGPGFVLVALVSYVASASSVGDDTRRLVVLALTAIWGLRLGIHLGRRNIGHEQDKRYTALLERRDGPLIPFLIRNIYGLQGLLMLVVSLSVQFAMYESKPLGILAALGIVIWTIGFAFESIGDWQLARFKSDPANKGKIMDQGLWGWTRHPNYFGDSCVWVGLFLLALGSPWGLLTIVSPIVMTFLLVRGSGKALLEKSMSKERGEAYQRYLETTSGFFPRPPKRG